MRRHTTIHVYKMDMNAKKNARVSLYYKCFNCICVITIMIIIMTMILMMILILILMMILILILSRLNLRARTSNDMVKGSRCRGGIVNTRGGCVCMRAIWLEGRKALWRFRASTSNSLSGRTWLHTHTPIRDIHQTYACLLYTSDAADE